MAKVVTLDTYKRNNKEKLDLIEFFYNKAEKLTLEIEAIKINNKGFEKAALDKIKHLQTQLAEIQAKYDKAITEYKTEYVGSNESENIKNNLLDKLDTCISKHFTDEIKELELKRGSERFNKLLL